MINQHLDFAYSMKHTVINVWTSAFASQRHAKINPLKSTIVQ
jgi:hypothetical protein